MTKKESKLTSEEKRARKREYYLTYRARLALRDPEHQKKTNEKVAIKKAQRTPDQVEADRKWHREYERVWRAKKPPKTPEQRQAKRDYANQFYADNKARFRSERYLRDWAKQLSKNSHKRGKVSDMSEAWIKDKFNEQQGRCFYSGLKMRIEEKDKDLFRPSLDRRDSSKDYTKDNVVLCCWGINAAKGTASEADFRAFLLEVKESKPTYARD